MADEKEEAGTEETLSVEDRLARLEGEHEALLEVLDRFGINLPPDVAGSGEPTAAAPTTASPAAAPVAARQARRVRAPK